jgi:TonB-dependent receptor
MMFLQIGGKNNARVWAGMKRRLLQKRCLCTVVLLLGLVQTSFGQGKYSALTQKISYSPASSSAAALLEALQKQSGYSFFFDKNELDKVQLQGLSLQAATLGTTLHYLQEQEGFAFMITGKSVAVSRNAAFKKPAAAPARKGAGKIAGKVMDEENGEPVTGATIHIDNQVVVTDIEGSFTFYFPKGNYTATVSHIGYGAKEVNEIIVKDNGIFELPVTLKRDKGQLSGVVVKASAKRESINALYTRQKNNAAVTDGISAEQISRTSDNNTAQVLRRISGLQVTDNKFVVVRGLSERYNNVMLNNGQLPSTEPNRRNFSFDIVPSALLDNIEVYKTATPDLPGEFTGGTVKINTKDIPEDNFTQLTVGTGFNTESTGKHFVSGERKTSDYLGFDSYRKLPADFSGAEYARVYGEWYLNKSDQAKLKTVAQMGSRLPSNWALYNSTAKPTQNYQFQLGRAYHFKNNNRLGFVGALTYRNEQTQFAYDYFRSALGLNYTGNEYNFTTAWGAIANISYAFGPHKISLKNLYNRRLEDKTAVYTGSGDVGPESNDISTFITNGLYQSRLEGEHQLSKKGIQLNWNADITNLKRDQPNSRTVYRYKQSDQAVAYTLDYEDGQQSKGSMYYSALDERRYSWGTDLKIPFSLLQQNQQFKAGYSGSYRQAAFGEDVYRYQSDWPGALGASALYGLPVYEALSPEMLATGGILLAPRVVSLTAGSNGSASGYNAFQRLNAAYGMFDLKPFEKLRLIGGLRTEINEQHVQSQVIVVEAGVVKSVDSLNVVKQTDFLPSVNAVYSLTKKINLRLAYSKTVARPDFRELSRFQYYDFRERLFISGTDLKTTTIQNFDFRAELYNKPGQIVSVGIFYKRFLNPIETQFSFSSANAAQIDYANLISAENKGVEFDFRQSLELFSKGSPILKNLYLSGNFTYLKATVKFMGDATRLDTETRDRPLIGQSPYIINGGLLYTGDKLGVNIVYNRYGKRLVTGGYEAKFDDYENPRDLLDIQLSYRVLQKKGEFRFNASDLLNQPFLIYANSDKSGNSSIETDPKGTNYNAVYDYARNRSVRGSTFTFSFSYHF